MIITSVFLYVNLHTTAESNFVLRAYIFMNLHRISSFSNEGIFNLWIFASKVGCIYKENEELGRI